MKKLFIFFFSMILFLATEVAWAEPYRRDVEFEWDPVEGAMSYDLELIGRRTLNFRTKEAQWAGKLAPGIYQMRLRARDSRGVPANWSTPEEFKVGLETPKSDSLAAEQKIETNETKDSKVEFSWKPVGGAKSYLFEVIDKNGETVHKEETDDTEIEVRLPVAKEYIWKVTAINDQLQSDEPLQFQFSLLGKKLDQPEIEKPETDFVREVKWEAVERAQVYDYSIERFNPRKKHWEKVTEKSGIAENRLDFDPKWPGGIYRLKLKAHSPLIPSSDETRVSFRVRNGDRSPAAEEIFTLRQSIDRLNGWYGIASYLITMMEYKGVNFDQSNSVLNYTAIGGTGRLGLGYLSPRHAWGFLAIADLSGLTVDNGGTYTFASTEANAVHRKSFGTRGELRQLMGVFYKELPETIGRSTSAITQTNLIKTAGPHYGAEYWYAFTSKFGMQINGHLYPSLLKIATPTNQAISPTVSMQLGVLGSYKLKRNVTGLMGYAYREDLVKYRAESGVGSARSGDLNSVSISGHYLNLFLEWAL